MKYYDTPELIGLVERIDADGESSLEGDRIIGVHVKQDSGQHREGTVTIDIREFDRKHGNIVVRLSLPDLVAAIATATLNADRE